MLDNCAYGIPISVLNIYELDDILVKLGTMHSYSSKKNIITVFDNGKTYEIYYSESGEYLDMRELSNDKSAKRIIRNYSKVE